MSTVRWGRPEGPVKLAVKLTATFAVKVAVKVAVKLWGDRTHCLAS